MPDEDLTESKLTIESLRLIQDWSKWLISLEAGTCVLLWSKTALPDSLFFGWMMFWASIISAGILLICIPFVIGRLNINSAEKGDMKKVWILVAVEYTFFLGGCICLACRVYRVWNP